MLKLKSKKGIEKSVHGKRKNFLKKLLAQQGLRAQKAQNELTKIKIFFQICKFKKKKKIPSFIMCPFRLLQSIINIQPIDMVVSNKYHRTIIRGRLQEVGVLTKCVNESSVLSSKKKKKKNHSYFYVLNENVCFCIYTMYGFFF